MSGTVGAPGRSLAQWLAWLEDAHPHKIDLGLERVSTVLGRMALPARAAPVITVAGTNGKGSCVAMLDAIYRAAGYRTGVYTSPHLLAYNERIRVSGHDATDVEICAAFERIERARGDTSLSYFEFGTLAALDIFARAGCEVLILEVGLGGRLDAVNVLDADAALITSVDIDHTHFLGPDRASIGAEKAGILRPDQVAVCNDPEPPESVQARARILGTTISYLGVDHHYRAMADGIAYGDAAGTLRLPFPALIGTVQARNAAGVVRLVRMLASRCPVPEAACLAGVRTARVTGRFDLRPGSPEWVLDVGHNPEAARNLARNLADFPVPGATVAVLGMLADKDIAGTLAPLLPHVSVWRVASLDGPRGASAEVLFAQLQAAGAPAAICRHADVASACAAAAHDGAARVLVFGSFHTVEAALRGGCVPAHSPPAGAGGGL